ncbi:hypothetical protein V8J82_11960 [Gymnodinialimonas sp. 2305UL16-5]|uniref:hypothetical protein n=1 Tax=Gymnodinialimonas mytili TaxID=3126503 RepID=UPI00309B2A98
MIRRLIPIAFLAIVLVVTSLAATIAQTRMVAAGVFCGPGSTAILLDATGLPILDAEGQAIAAPDCLACHLHGVAAPAPMPFLQPPASLGAALPVSHVLNQTHPMVTLGGQARAPPMRRLA